MHFEDALCARCLHEFLWDALRKFLREDLVRSSRLEIAWHFSRFPDLRASCEAPVSRHIVAPCDKSTSLLLQFRGCVT